jgi:RNA polymerase sigma-70 factor, ECF subfamily
VFAVVAASDERHESCAPDGEPGAARELRTEIYRELRQIAAQHLRNERRGSTLQTTVLAHEAYLRLAADQRSQPYNAAEFRAAAAVVVRRVLVDHARRRRRLKRGGPHARQVRLDTLALDSSDTALDVLAIDEALGRLAELSPRQARVVELRFFGGLSEEEAAGLLGVARRTVQKDWRGARAWLRRELTREQAEGAT